MINEYFEETYLTCGNTYDNYIFFDCPTTFISYAKEKLSSSSNDIKPCNIEITDIDESFIVKMLDKCDSDFFKKLLARDYIYSLFMIELIKNNPCENDYCKELCDGISDLKSNMGENFKNFHIVAPTDFDIQQIIRKLGKIELNIFCVNTQNKFIQQAINNLVSSRTPYSIKLFTTNSALPSYYDQGGNLIESPHDYIHKNFKSLQTDNRSFDM